jgi:hypothetical protein
LNSEPSYGDSYLKIGNSKLTMDFNSGKGFSLQSNNLIIDSDGNITATSGFIGGVEIKNGALQCGAYGTSGNSLELK